MNRRQRLAVLAKGLAQIAQDLSVEAKDIEYAQLRAQLTVVNNLWMREKDPKKKARLKKKMDNLITRIKKTKTQQQKEKRGRSRAIRKLKRRR